MRTLGPQADVWAWINNHIPQNTVLYNYTSRPWRLKQVSVAWIGNAIPQHTADVITHPCPRYPLLPKSPIMHTVLFNLICLFGVAFRWFCGMLQYLQYVRNGDTAALH